METQKTLSLADFFDFLWRGLPLALALAGLLGFLVYLYQRQVPETYTADATLAVVQEGVAQNVYGVPVRANALKLSDYRTAISSESVLASGLGLSLDESLSEQERVEDLADSLRVRAQSPNASNFLTIEVTRSSPSEAAEFANAVANALIEWDRRRANDAIGTAIAGVSRQISLLELQLDELPTGTPEAPLPAEVQAQREQLIGLRSQKRLQLLELRSVQGEGQSNLELVELATVPFKPSSVSPLLVTAVAALLGLFLGYALHLTRAVLTRRLLSAADLAEATGLSVLVDVPSAFPGPLMEAAPRLASYLRARLAQDDAGSAYLVTGNHDRAGQEQVGLALAGSFARSGKRALWLSTDPKRSAAAWEAQVTLPVTFTPLEELLNVPDLDPAPATLHLPNDVKLDLLYGLEEVGGLEDVLSSHLAALFDRLWELYDVVVVSAPSPLTSANALIVAPLCQNALVSCDLNHARQKETLELILLLEGVGAELLGAVTTRGQLRPNRRGARPAARAQKTSVAQL